MNNNKGFDDGDELRRRAEAATRQIGAQARDSAECLSPEELGQTLHELHVHQIELEMQNEELRRAQVELEAVRARYFDLYDLAPVGYVTVSEKGIILEGNLTAATLLGVARGALVGQPVSRFIFSEDQDIHYRHRKALFARGEAQSYEMRMLREGSTPFWAQLEATPARGENGAATLCRIALSDITARKFLEEARALSAGLLGLVDAPGDLHEYMAGLVASLKDWSGCDAVGIRLRDGDDFPYYETHGFSSAFVREESRLCASAPNGEFLRDGAGTALLECICGTVLSGRYDPAKPFFTDRGSFWCNGTSVLRPCLSEAELQTHIRNRCNTEGYESVALVPLRAGQELFGLLQFNDRNPDRFTPGLIVHFENMAESVAIALSRRKSAEALRQSEERNRTILQTAMDGFWVADTQGRLLEVNEAICRMSGYSEQELLVLGIPDLEASETKEISTAHFQKVITQGEDRFETRLRRKNGTLIDVEVSVQHKAGEDGRFVAFVHDISQRKQAEEERAALEERLGQAEKMESVGRLAGGVAHDFNNMLAVILGYAEVALGKVDPCQPLYEDLQEIRKAAVRSADLTRQLLGYARKQTVMPVLLDLNETVSGMLKMVQPLIGEDIHLVWSPAADLWPVMMDPSQIGQILTNLCVNARDAICDVGRLTIETTNRVCDDFYCAFRPDFAPGDYVLLVVTDNGRGMDRETMDKVFEPFFTTKGVGKGTGLGLATLYGIVKQNHGFINVYSELGQGTVFTVYLPRYVGKEDSAPAETVAAKVPHGGETVLLVEDEAAVLKLSSRMLRELGYTVLAAESPGEALRLAGKHHEAIGLMVTDVIMPEMNGHQLAQKLQVLYPGLKCLFMSGYTASVIAQHGVLDKGTHFIQKPFSMPDLAAKVREALAVPDAAGVGAGVGA